MPTPSPRTPVLPARGFYAVVAALSADIQEGELVYIKDQNTLYVKEAGALVPILGSGAVATNSIRAGDNVSKLANDAGYITLADVEADRVLSVNGELGSVILDADDIPTAGTINKFTTEDDINKLAGIQPGAEINEVNEAPIDGNSYVRKDGAWVVGSGGGGAVDSVNGQTGVVVLDADDISTTGTANKFTTAADITKLAGIAPGAEVNVNADWNAVVGDALILNKPVLGTAASQNTSAFATAAQGTKADSALQPAAIGVTVQAYNAGTVIDASYVHTDNNYTTAEKTKLSGIAAGAEVNVNADWNAVSGDAQILNKPTLGTAASQNTTAFATAAQGAKADTALQPATIGVTVQAYNAGTVVDASYVHTDNNYTTTEKNKLAGIAAGAEVNVNADWNAVSGDAQILNKPTLGTAASQDSSAFATAAQGALASSAVQPGDNVSDLTNDAGYATVSRFFSLITTAATANTSGTVTLPKAGMALKIYTSKAGWFRLYNTAAAAAADAGRAQGTDPAPGSGVLLETITTAGQTIVLTPVPNIVNMESPVTNSYPWAFSNTTDTASAAIEVWYLSIQA